MGVRQAARMRPISAVWSSDSPVSTPESLSKLISGWTELVSSADASALTEGSALADRP